MAPAVKVEYCPLSIIVFDSFKVLATCAGFTVTVLLVEHTELGEDAESTELKL